MNKKITIGAISVGSVILVIAFGWLVSARFTNQLAADVSVLKNTSTTRDASTSAAEVIPTPSTISADHVEITEDGSDEEAMNVHWLSRINALRQQKNLEPIIFDTRLAHTARVWAVHMGTTGSLSHERPDGQKVSEWIKTYDLPFIARRAGSGYRNVFTENIGRAYADTSIKSLEAGLDQVLTAMVNEGPDGDHYRTIFSPDWNRYGGGFYFEQITTGRVRVYMAFHYAILQ